MSAELKKHIEELRDFLPSAGAYEGDIKAVIAAAERCEAAEALCAELRNSLVEIASIKESTYGDHWAAYTALDTDSVRDICNAATDKTPADMGKELSELREDKARLDSGVIRITHMPNEWGIESTLHSGRNLRADIDAARKEGGAK